MNITNVKALVAKMFTVGLIAGAVVIAAPSKAQAQISLGVRVGPVVSRPIYRGDVYAPGYYDRYDHEAWERRQAYLRHEQEERFERERIEQARIQRERFEHERFEHQQYDAQRFDRRDDDRGHDNRQPEDGRRYGR